MEAQDYVLALKGHKLTQAQIAERTGIPQPTISKIERGEVSDVMSRNYRALQSLHAEVEKQAAAQAGPRPAGTDGGQGVGVAEVGGV